MKAERGIEARLLERVEVLGSVGGNDFCGSKPSGFEEAGGWLGWSILSDEGFLKNSSERDDEDPEAISRSYLSKPLFAL